MNKKLKQNKDKFEFYSLKKLRKQIGDYSFIRFLRNQKISFSTAYFIMFQVSPRLERK